MLNLRADTPQLVVLEPQDAAILQRYYTENAAHLRPWEPTRPADYLQMDRVSALLAERYERYVDRSALHVAAVDEQGTMVAECNFTNIAMGAFRACNLGFSIAKAQEGKGIMTRTVQRSVGILFSEYGLHRIMANYMPKNTRSQHVLERCGFIWEGYAKKYLRIAGTWEDHVLTSLISPHENVETGP